MPSAESALAALLHLSCTSGARRAPAAKRQHTHHRSHCLYPLIKPVRYRTVKQRTATCQTSQEMSSAYATAIHRAVLGFSNNAQLLSKPRAPLQSSLPAVLLILQPAIVRVQP